MEAGARGEERRGGSAGGGPGVGGGAMPMGGGMGTGMPSGTRPIRMGTGMQPSPTLDTGEGDGAGMGGMR